MNFSDVLQEKIAVPRVNGSPRPRRCTRKLSNAFAMCEMRLRR